MSRTSGDISDKWQPISTAAVFMQFWKPVMAYGLLSGNRNMAIALAMTAVVIVLAGSVPLFLFSWEDLETEWRTERGIELSNEGHSAAETDSTLAAELEEIRWRRNSMPFIGLAERIFYSLIGGLATFGAAYAAGVTGSLPAHLKSASLSQGAYVLTAFLLAVISTVLSLPAGFNWSGAMLFDTTVLNPSRLYVFAYLFGSHLDLPSMVSVSLWGIGLSVLLGRPVSFGLRISWFVYICGILLISMPVLITASGGAA